MRYFDHQPADRVLEDNWKITVEDWTCQWEYKGQFRRLFVPSGYVYDGASVPRMAWTVSGCHPDGEIRAGSLAHDALYRAAGGKKPSKWFGCKLTNPNGNKVVVGRAEADMVLRMFMEYATAPKPQCRRAWLAVRVAGWAFWGKEPPSGKRPK